MLTALNREQIQRFFNKKSAGSPDKKGLSPKSLKNIYNMLNSTLEQAVTNEKIIRNPLRGIKLPKIVKKEIRILETDEQTKLQTAARNSPEPQAFGIIFTLSTGVRLGELLGLKQSDLNYQRHSVIVRRTVGRLQRVDENGSLIKRGAGIKTTEIVVRSPKSANSQREIPLFDELWNELLSYCEKMKAMMDDFGIPYNQDSYVFCNYSGNPYDPRVYEDLFKRTLKAANLERINFHALRHTFATRALEAGMDIKVLSSILGHAQASTTLNLYAHALADHRKLSMDKMSEYYSDI